MCWGIHDTVKKPHLKNFVWEASCDLTGSRWDIFMACSGRIHHHCSCYWNGAQSQVIPLYCDIMPKSQNTTAIEVLQRCPLPCSGLLKHVSVAVNMNTAVGPRPSYLRRARRVVAWHPESWEGKIWLWVLQDLKPKMTMLLRTSSNLHKPARGTVAEHWRVRLLEVVTKQRVQEDVTEQRDLGYAVVVCRSWRIMKIL
jgi:hypothetical protein